MSATPQVLINGSKNELKGVNRYCLISTYWRNGTSAVGRGTADGVQYAPLVPAVDAPPVSRPELCADRVYLARITGTPSGCRPARSRISRRFSA